MERIRQLKDIDQKCYCSDYYDFTVNIYGVKCGTSLRFGKIMLGTRSLDDEKQINRQKKIVSRFRDKLVKMIKDADSKYDNYSFLPKNRQILLHWGYELTKKYLFINSTN